MTGTESSNAIARKEFRPQWSVSLYPGGVRNEWAFTLFLRFSATLLMFDNPCQELSGSVLRGLIKSPTRTWIVHFVALLRPIDRLYAGIDLSVFAIYQFVDQNLNYFITWPPFSGAIGKAFEERVVKFVDYGFRKLMISILASTLRPVFAQHTIGVPDRAGWLGQETGHSMSKAIFHRFSEGTT